MLLLFIIFVLFHQVSEPCCIVGEERADGIDFTPRADKMRRLVITTSRKVKEMQSDPSDMAFQKFSTLLMETD